jgi:hypothetical protein
MSLMVVTEHRGLSWPQRLFSTLSGVSGYQFTPPPQMA